MGVEIQGAEDHLKACLVKMIEAEMAGWRFIESLPNTVEINLPDVGLLDQVLTVLGFPDDTTLKHWNPDDPACENHPDYFCRDWLITKLTDATTEGWSATQYIEWAQEQLHSMFQTKN